jgi:polar amino acid transport system substrate-binding protein
VRRLLAVVAVALAVPALTVAAAAPPALRVPNVLTVGSEFPTPGFISASRAHPTGYDADLVNAIASRLGLRTVVWREVPWGLLWKADASKSFDFDFDIDSITITAERAKSVDFSVPYFRANLGLVVRRGTPIAQAQTLKELRGYRLGSQSWATGFTYLTQTLRPATPPVPFNSNPATVSGLQTGKVNGLLVDVPTAVLFASQHPRTLIVAGQVPIDQRYGLLFPKASPLRAQVNAAIAALQDDGTLARLQQKWFPGSLSLRVIR